MHRDGARPVREGLLGVILVKRVIPSFYLIALPSKWKRGDREIPHEQREAVTSEAGAFCMSAELILPAGFGPKLKELSG